MVDTSKISQQIQVVMDNVKAMKTNESRNRIMSHLKDARAHAIVDEAWVSPSLSDSAPVCICPPGATDSNCPVHGIDNVKF